MSKAAQFTNRLKDEKSPYLRQHANNPVDWYPWSEEALQRARREDKPVILSIGYSACHWCHVMERESFEDNNIAKIMNENFVNIKVDREERPDLDSLYMKAVQMMTGHAGWPLTVFATPEGAPFYGGSYFPPEDQYGLPSFKKVLLAVSLAYKKNKKRIETVTSDVEGTLKKRNGVTPIELSMEISDAAYDSARIFFDPVNGGFGRGTKFPHAMFLKFLIRYHERTGVKDASAIVNKSLIAMAEGGIYDHVGGGFHRYSVDERWDIPHFEKMLYDNAMLSELYSIAYDSTGKAFYRDVAIETVNYMLRELRDENGGFYSAQDADVNGEEGAYYLWGDDEIKSVLGNDAGKFMEYFPVTKEGNYDGKNMLRISQSVKLNNGLPAEIKRLKGKLFNSRQARRAPDTDRKIITAWNGLAISALAQAAMSFKEKGYIEEAKRAANFILNELREGGRVLRYFLDGKAAIKGNLEDYALLANGLFSIYEVTGAKEWLKEAGSLAEEMTSLFYDEGSNLFFDTGKDQEQLFMRERDLFDNDVPSGNSAAADILSKIAGAGRGGRYRKMSEDIIRSVAGIEDEPLSYGNFLSVLENAERARLMPAAAGKDSG
ncbi:MAG: thioredoxin domain-containing protein [Deltaproteobacteria bacterium]|nr:thioredoxin domain-containing protein [Deltaproteobacteria bacterium]